jgi:Predicted nucleic acid-binding protein, contains PIN domain
MNYMLDTNICIYLIKRKPVSVLKKMQEHMQEGLYISSITLAELEHGVFASAAIEKNNIALNQFLSIIEILNFNDEAAFEYGKIVADLKRKGTPIGSMDSLIAAHAIATGKILVTNNVKEFERVVNLKVENWVTD